MVRYPIKADPFVAAYGQQPTPRSCRLRKDFIKAVLQDLHDDAPEVYHCLENLPEKRFAIVRCHDHVRRLIRPDSSLESDTFTIDLFLRYYELLHAQDEFRVRFYTGVFYDKRSFTPHTLEIVYRHYLKYLRAVGLPGE